MTTDHKSVDPQTHTHTHSTPPHTHSTHTPTHTHTHTPYPRIGSGESLRSRNGNSYIQQELKRHKSDEHAHRVMLSDREHWAEHSGDSSLTGRNAESDTSGSHQATPQASSQASVEEQKMSGDSGSVKYEGSFKTRRLVKSYQSQRAQLHKGRMGSKTSLQEGDGLMPVGEKPRIRRRPSREEEGGFDSWRSRRRGSSKSSPPYEQDVPRESHSDSVFSVESPQSDKPERLAPERVRPVMQVSREVEEEAPHEPIRKEYRKVTRERPLSATASVHIPGSPGRSHTLDSRSHGYSSRLDSFTRSAEVPSSHHKFTHSVEVPLRPDSSRKIPLFHTRSAQTPYGEQIVTEVQIDEVIRAREAQFGTCGSPRSYSMDSGVVVSAQDSEEPVWKRKDYLSPFGNPKQVSACITPEVLR